MTEPAQHDGNTPTIHLDGRDWPVPVFVWRQLEQSRAKIIGLNDAIIGSQKDGKVNERYISLDDGQYRTVGEVVYQALLGAHPKLTVEEFRNMRISDGELFAAFLVARRQSGIYVFSDAAECGSDDAQERSPPGEAQAESRSQTQTGTE